MAKTATKVQPSPSIPPKPKDFSKASSGQPKKPSDTDDEKPSDTLPASLVKALPTGAKIAAHVRAIEALLPDLKRDLDTAEKDGVNSLARAYVVFHRLHDMLLSDEAEALKPFKEAYKTLKELRFPEACEQAGVENVPLSEGFRVAPGSVVRASIRPDKKVEAFDWLREHEKGDVIQPTVNSSTLSALAREMREVNEDLPEELFNVADVGTTSVTKIKTKK